MSEDLHLCNDTFFVVTIPPLRGEIFFFPPQKTKSDLEVTIFIIFENSVRTPGCVCNRGNSCAEYGPKVCVCVFAMMKQLFFCGSMMLLLS